jgi:ribosomal protein S18 acetylase RimI-like enzyme
MDEIRIKILQEGDEALLENVADGVFDGPVVPQLVHEFLTDPRHHIAVATNAAGLVVGMASALHYIHPDKPPQLFVNEVGVADAYQRRGIGLLLVNELLAHGKRLGCAEAWVATEADNLPARALYRKAGGEESTDQIVLATFKLRE